MSRIKWTLSVEPHPLETVVLAAFAGARCHDATTLATFLGGAVTFHGRKGASVGRAYRVVALDVLGYMAAQGKLWRDGDGWYHRPS